MIDAMEWSRGAWRGVAMIDETASDRELERLHAAGARGVRFNFVAHLGGAPDLAKVNAVVARVAPLGWHVELHLDAHDIATYRGFLDALPVPYIIDHMGRVEARLGLEQAPFRLLLDLMKDARTWIKVSGAERVSSAGKPYHDAIPFARALIAAAPDRVLWGTDFPHPNVKEMPNDGEQVNLFAQVCTDPALRKKILVDNPDTLYWPDVTRA
jgi:predicted TIM-barrel fold metal-dependent hydrolase